jgi:hypothetical protein
MLCSRGGGESSSLAAGKKKSVRLVRGCHNELNSEAGKCIRECDPRVELYLPSRTARLKLKSGEFCGGGGPTPSRRYISPEECNCSITSDSAL